MKRLIAGQATLVEAIEALSLWPGETTMELYLLYPEGVLENSQGLARLASLTLG